MKHIKADMFDDFLCKSNVYKAINNRYAIYINRVTKNKKSFVASQLNNIKQLTNWRRSVSPLKVQVYKMSFSLHHQVLHHNVS